MKKLLTIAASFTILFTSIAPISCISNKNYHINETDQIISNYNDFDCEAEIDLHNKVEGDFNEHYPTSIEPDLYKVDKCILQNFNKSAQPVNEQFDQFINNNLSEYNNFDQINQKLKSASKNVMDLNRLLAHIKDVANFKTTIVFVYNVLAKLLGEKIAPYLIFNLVITDQFNASSTLAVSVGFSDQMGLMDHMCIKYSDSALNIDYEKLAQNYENGFWATDNINHPFVHEFGHIVDYFMRMPIEKRYALLKANPLNYKSCNLADENNNLIDSVYPNRIQSFNVSVGSQKLKNYLYYNIKNHHLVNNLDSRKILAHMIVTSRYSNEEYGEGELFAEAFAKWLLTKKAKRGKNWQILHRFFTDYIFKKLLFSLIFFTLCCWILIYEVFL